MILFFKRSLIVLNLVLVLLTLMANLSPFVHPADIPWISFTGLFFPILFLGNICFVIAWLSFSRAWSLMSAACLVISIPGATRMIQFHTVQELSADQRGHLIVGTYNIRNLNTLQAPGTRAIPPAALKAFTDSLFQKNPPHILCLQEGNNRIFEIADRLQLKHVFAVPNSQTYILSKFALLDQGKIRFEEGKGLCGWIDIATPLDTIRIFNLHLKSNQITEKAERIFEGPDIRSKRVWSDGLSMMKKYEQTTKIRATQALEVIREIKASPHPVIVCGDLNDVPQSFTYQVLQRELRDTFLEKGVGLGTTYAGGIPGLRIDYVMVSEHFDVFHHRVMEVAYSDHYPVITQLGLRE